MEKQFTFESKTGDIVIDFPKSSSILRENKIGFCCSNNRPIGDITEDLGLDKVKILDRINSLYENNLTLKQQDDWNDCTVDEVIDRIIELYHYDLQQVLPDLHGYVSKIYRVHGGRNPELVTIHSLYNVLTDDINKTILRKEQSIFPLLKEPNRSIDQQNQLSKSMEQLEGDYATINELIASIRKSTGNFILPEGVCNTFRLTFIKLEELETDMHELMQLENQHLFDDLSQNRRN